MYFRDKGVLSDAVFSSDAPCISFAITAGQFFLSKCLKETCFMPKYPAIAIYHKISFDGYMSKVLLTFTSKNTSDSNT